VNSVVEVESVGGNLVALGGTIYAAIIPLSSPTALPPAAESYGLENVTPLATTVFTPPFPSDEILVPLSVRLNPGDYALIFGSGQFGATGDAGMYSENDFDIPGSASYIYWNGQIDQVWHDSPFGGYRFVVTGRVIPEPATWLLVVASLGFLVFHRRGEIQ
jgi:hypothetical protein